MLFNGVRLPDKKIVKTILNTKIVKYISVLNLHKEKGIEITLSELDMLKNIGISCWTYDIIGAGYQRDNLISIVNRMGLNNHIKFHGALKHNAVIEKLIDADVFVLPSYREAFGVAYLEAMACGLLTVAVESQGPSAVINHLKNGLLVKSRSPESLFESMKLTIDEKSAMRILAKNGQDHVYNNFSWSDHAKKLIRIYDVIGAG